MSGAFITIQRQLLLWKQKMSFKGGKQGVKSKLYKFADYEKVLFSKFHFYFQCSEINLINVLGLNSKTLY